MKVVTFMIHLFLKLNSAIWKQILNSMLCGFFPSEFPRELILAIPEKKTSIFILFWIFFPFFLFYPDFFPFSPIFSVLFQPYSLTIRGQEHQHQNRHSQYCSSKIDFSNSVQLGFWTPSVLENLFYSASEMTWKNFASCWAKLDAFLRAHWLSTVWTLASRRICNRSSLCPVHTVHS